MASFPTILRRVGLTQTPIVNEEIAAFDPTVRSQYEGGYVSSRSRFTRIPRRWDVKYEWMTTVNKGTLQTFEEARGVGSESFTWTNPMDSTSYTVRFLEPVRYTPTLLTNFQYWTVEFILEEV